MQFGKSVELMPMIGSVGFVTVVAVLHLIQPGYDPINQLMSELALGPYGWAMFFAFGFLAVAAGGCLLWSRALCNGIFTQVLLLIGVCAFAGAGVFPLGTSSEEHVFFITLAFVSMSLVMYVLPKQIKEVSRAPSWALAIGMGLSVALGGGVLPAGIAQRLAALCLITWFVWIGMLILKNRI